jgi:ribosomal protein S18 acetylase RimI-like enzyme
MQFTNKAITIATTINAVDIAMLLNSAYRGESSKEGWTTEANLIAGDIRTNADTVIEVMQKAGSVFLIYTVNNTIIGCVNLQKQDEKLYLGMFSVSPSLQGGGVGRQILQAIEAYATHINCNIIYMSVISVRTELINWYKRNGYYETGERQPFIEDSLSGKHLQQLEFLILEKIIASKK